MLSNLLALLFLLKLVKKSLLFAPMFFHFFINLFDNLLMISWPAALSGYSTSGSRWKKGRPIKL